jgi:hypothetical protein
MQLGPEIRANPNDILVRSALQGELRYESKELGIFAEWHKRMNKLVQCFRYTEGQVGYGIFHDTLG